MTEYLILIFVNLFGELCPRNQKLLRQFILFTSVLYLYFFLLFRGQLGYDYFSYLDVLLSVDAANFARFEPGNRILVQLAQYTNMPNLFFIIHSIIFLTFINLSIQG